MQGLIPERPRFVPSPGRNAWIPPALSSALTLVVGVLLAEAWRRFGQVAERVDMDVSQRKIYNFVFVLSAIFVLWRTWYQGRRALRLWRQGRR